tara:strand:+ start:2506 stop:3831 length:1326 start_codon:yes stop_codon:yes gene_type:complete
MISKENIWNYIFEGGLILLVLFSSIFTGSVDQTSSYWLQIFIFLLVFLFLVKKLALNDSEFYYPKASIFLGLFFIFLVFQCLPLSLSILKIISPKTALLYHQALPAAFEKNLFSITIYSLATKKEAIKLFSFFCIFFITINTINTRRQFQRMILIIILWSVILTFYGLVKKFSLNQEHYLGFSTFLNRNHYAGYCILIIPFSAGYALANKNLNIKILFSFITGMLGLSVFLTASRAAILSIIVSLSLMIFLSFYIKKIKEKKNIAIGICALLGMVFLFSLFDFGGVISKFKFLELDTAGRFYRFKDAFSAVKDFPLFGVGLGNFRYIFTSYRTFHDIQFQSYLHNDHLQLFLETGLIGISLYISFFLFIIKDIVKQYNKRKDPFVKNIVLGGLFSILALGIDSFFDLDFHIPAIAFMFWLILGLIYKCAHTHFGGSEKTPL